MNNNIFEYFNFQPMINGSPIREDHELWFIIKNNEILFKNIFNNIEIPTWKDIKHLNNSFKRIHHMGKLFDKSCFCCEIADDINIGDELIFSNLREASSDLTLNSFLLCGKASQILDWDKNHEFCGRCGSKTIILENERAKKCPKCNLINYPRISPAIIVAITKGNQILLAHNKNFIPGLYSVIAGFVEPSETLEDCVKREVFEEVGIKIKNITYFGSQPWPFPNSLMIAFFAEYKSGEIKVDGNEIVSADWYEVDKLPDIPQKHSVARKLIDTFINNQLNSSTQK